MMNKRSIYITAFIILGVLVSFLAHALIEIPAIVLLVSDFDTWGLGLSWETWVALHNVFSILLLLLGVFVGYKQGVYWWERIYGGK